MLAMSHLSRPELALVWFSFVFLFHFRAKPPQVSMLGVSYLTSTWFPANVNNLILSRFVVLAEKKWRLSLWPETDRLGALSPRLGSDSCEIRFWRFWKCQNRINLRFRGWLIVNFALFYPKKLDGPQKKGNSCVKPSERRTRTGSRPPPQTFASGSPHFVRGVTINVYHDRINAAQND